VALFFLFVAFCFSLYGGWVFFDGYFTATSPNEQWLAAIVGIAFAVIPYMIAKCLADMVAIRQRHITTEQQMQQTHLLNQQLQAQTRNIKPKPSPPTD
jgi:hypothetical protein